MLKRLARQHYFTNRKNIDINESFNNPFCQKRFYQMHLKFTQRVLFKVPEVIGKNVVVLLRDVKRHKNASELLKKINDKNAIDKKDYDKDLIDFINYWKELKLEDKQIYEKYDDFLKQIKK